eukprot:TRINITY_DN6589_c0_g1_i1.p1 TRINITY_DN6589_c0_g1~~TRINITY_DN6589_c0_g1_i1.p1  ORF type:complete len:538 (-),score=179.05 TRINITY_DN6589_c0_g1_i1:688-2301(-)
METLGTQLGAYMQQQSRLDKRHASGEDDPVTSEASRDGDSPLSRLPPSDVDSETLEKLRRQEREEREEIERELRSQDSNGNKGLPLGLEGLEAFRRQYLASPLSRGFPGLLPPLPSAPEHPYKSSSPQTPPNNSSSHSTPSSEFSSQQNWSFEEQFKQLYELNDDPKRKEFLDDLFSFMQKRGTPINRLPIMAKQVLDLYELYNLVCARGGLVEVINKKQWQEIIKGLNLPSSITSAAFTLRTQYTKYIYPYECENKKLSHPNELQCAIEGNRREGRRSGYESYNMFSQHSRSPSMPLPPSSLAPHLSHSLRPSLHGGMFNPGGLGGGCSSPPPSSSSPLNALEMTRLALFKMYNQASPLPTSSPHLPPQFLPDSSSPSAKISSQHHQHQHHQAQQAQQQRAESRRKEEARDLSLTSGDARTTSFSSSSSPPPVKRERTEAASNTTPGNNSGNNSANNSSSSTAGEKSGGKSPGTPENGANIRIASRGDNSGDSSLVVSLEINSVMYQGVLFAQSSTTPGEAKSSANSPEVETAISE